jgi:hypothetical protein
LQASGSRRKARRLLEFGEQVVVRQEEAVDGAVEDDDLQVLVLLHEGNHLVQLRDGLGSEDVEGRMVEGHPQVGR